MSDHPGQEFLDAAFGAQEQRRRAYIEEAKRDPGSVRFAGRCPVPLYYTEPPPGSVALLALCEKYAHPGRLGNKCAAGNSRGERPVA